jgi:aspartyl-tRNA(Asn)/glutamyl-tRNA(Gln) amidotransferase subunit C
MAVTTELVEHIAALARLRLEPAEPERYRRELNHILEHVAALGGLDLREVQPFDMATEERTPARADEPALQPLALDLPALAPAFRDGFFVVPRLPAQRGRGPAAHDDT